MIEKVKPAHVDRKAILYVRQSSTHQVFHHLEGQRLQYAMKEQLLALGWQTIDVIDEDLGKSAAGSRERSGFERMVAEVCLAKVGVVAAWELSRFARNSCEWQQLIEVCRVVDTLLVDQEAVLEDGKPRRVNRVKHRDEWLVLQRDHHEGYITWATHERIQEMIHRNAQVCAPVDAGAAKRGPAMLAGRIRCRRCGRKLMVRYAGGSRRRTIRYVCHRGFQGGNEEPCIAFSGAPIDDAVVNEVMRVIQPGAVEAALLATHEAMKRHDQGLRALELELKTRQYEAQRAQRQYDASDPENRLVTAELERRWNATMERVAELERKIEQEAQRRKELEPPTSEAFLTLAQDVHRVWNDPRTDNRLKKRIIRALIEEVIADVGATEIHIVIHWKGGVHTELHFPRRRSGETRCRVPKDVVEAVRILSRLCSDAHIAGWLTRNGLRTGKGNCWTRQHVTGLRHRHDITVYKAERQEAEGWMNLSQAAAYLGVDRGTLSVAIQRGEIPAVRPLPIGPLVLKRVDLDKDAGRKLSQRVERHRRFSGRRGTGDETLDLFNKNNESPGGVV